MQPQRDGTSIAEDVDHNGFAVVPNLLPREALAHLLAALVHADIARARRGDVVFGGRNLLDVPAVGELALSHPIRELIAPIVGADSRPIRALFFDKTPEANWPVLWHQDLSIAVAEKHEISGWGPWSTKAGVTHVQPPIWVLEAILAVRLHIDDCGPDNGPLRTLPGTHRLGRLDRDRIAALKAQIPEAVCVARAGSALLMRPLLLHASSPARAPSHRRVVHIEYAPEGPLPAGLKWAFGAALCNYKS